MSYKLVSAVSDFFPDSSQVSLLGLQVASDEAIWQYAKKHGYVLVSQDSDFYDLSLLRGQPPKVVWLRLGNTSTKRIQALLIEHYKHLQVFALDPHLTCLMLS